MEFQFRMSQDVRKADATELMLLKVNVKKNFMDKKLLKNHRILTTCFFSGHTDPV